jgi:hypothetical protein
VPGGCDSPAPGDDACCHSLGSRGDPQAAVLALGRLAVLLTGCTGGESGADESATPRLDMGLFQVVNAPAPTAGDGVVIPARSSPRALCRR